MNNLTIIFQFSIPFGVILFFFFFLELIFIPFSSKKLGQGIIGKTADRHSASKAFIML